MADKWDKQLMQLLRRTGEELKRSGEELRVEAQRLLTEVRDPANQAKVRAGVEELKTWAKQAGRDATELLETTVRKVEGAVESTFQSRAAQQAPTTPATPAA
ncbi:MAG TPA: transcriptional regulator, partial [Aggregicoccus sp.]|nr:transcriptional regulator [Aggregicoccus sp.]